MRAAAFALLALVACNEPTRHYTGLSDGQGGGDGPRGDGPLHDTMPDGFVGPAPMTNAYLLDTGNGKIVHLAKDPTSGTLSVVGGNIGLTAPVSAAINRQGTHMYVPQNTGSMPAVADFTRGANGNLGTPNVLLIAPCMSPGFATVHPSGNWLAVGCGSANFEILPISGTGALGSPISYSAGQNPLAPAFTPEGKCLYFADLNGANGIHVLAFQFDANTGNATPVNGAAGPSIPRAIAVHPTRGVVYVGGSINGTGAVVGFTYDPNSCALTQSPAITGTVGVNTTFATITPDLNHLIVTGTEVYSFEIATNGALTPAPGNPFLASGNVMDSAIVDPGMPDTVYITGRGYSGSLEVQVAADGAVTQSSMLTVNATSPQWLQLAP